MGAIFASLEKDDDILQVGMNRAMDVLGKKLASVRTLGEHPKDREPVLVRKGRFGPYVQHGQTVANLPRDRTMEDFTLDEAVPLLAEKGKPLKPRGKKGAPAKAKPARKAAPAADAAPGPPAAKVAAKAVKPAAGKVAEGKAATGKVTAGKVAATKPAKLPPKAAVVAAGSGRTASKTRA